MDTLQTVHTRLDEGLGEACSPLPGCDGAIGVSHDVVQSSPLHGDLETLSSILNFVLGPQEIKLLINAVVSGKNADLCSLASHMVDVDSAVRKFAAIRMTLEQSSGHVREPLLAHQAPTSPAHRIPPEVLGEVFYHCLSKTPYITPRSVESPMVLTQVCRHWRRVAMSTPRLWSSFSIYVQKTACDAYRRGCETWLARAKSVPLTVRVLNDLAPDSTLVPSAEQWLRGFIAHCGDLWWHGPCLPTIFVPEAETGIDLPLERLWVTSHRDKHSIHFPGPARGLRSVSLQCLNYDLRSLDGITLPWTNLVELHMHFALFGSTVFLELLGHCTRLRTLVVSCLCGDEDELSAVRALCPGSVVHASLSHVEIKVIRAGLDVLFSALSLPALSELDVCFCYRERDAWPHAQFMGLMERSRCALRRLTVRSNKNAVPYFNAYVEAMPGLTISTTAPDWVSR